MAQLQAMLEQMYQHVIQAPARDPLIAAVISLASEQKLALLSARTLGERAGVAASAVNYHHGSVSALVEAATAQADLACAAHWRAEAGRLGPLTLSPDDFAPLAFRAIQTQVRHHRGEVRLIWNRRIGVARSGRPPEAAPHIAAEQAFWSKLLSGCGMAHLLPENMVSLSSALTFAYLTFADPADFDPWALALIQRFSDRALGRSVTDADNALRCAAEAAASLAEPVMRADHDTAQRILAAAIALIMSDGAETVTHRAIAAHAGLSVSSVQHFFGTRRAILLAAFRAVYDRTRKRAVPDLPDRATLLPDDLLRPLYARLDDAPEEGRREFAAMNGLIFSASEDEDSRAIAHGLLARQGETSMYLLASLRHFRGPLSRLDGQLFSMVLAHDGMRPQTDQPSSGHTPAARDVVRNLIDGLFL
jgi:AcrR family transcriptional regulator